MIKIKTTDNSKTMLNLFFEVAENNPERIAIKEGENQYSYLELLNFIENISFSLREKGISSGNKVAVELSHSVELIAALFAIQCVGASYIPIDRRAPKERNRLILDDANPELIINYKDLDIHQGYATSNIYSMINNISNDKIYDQSSLLKVAYIIYTSGTTGRPKAVPITHENLSSLFYVTYPIYNFNEDDITLLYHSYAFDFSVWEIWSVLAYGGKLVIPDEETRTTPYKLAELVKNEKITLLNQTPTSFSINCEYFLKFKPEEFSLRFIIFGGERLNFKSLKNWNNKFGLYSPKLVNMYGITETTVHASWHIIEKDDLEKSESIIGHILPEFDYVIRKQGSNISKIGELLLSGPQVTNGYLNDDKKNNDKFIWLEHNGIIRRYYCSGDLIYNNEKGQLVYYGRCDQQVKINGYRIEIGEVESVLTSYDKVNEILVIPSNSEIVGEHLICIFTSSITEEYVIDNLKELAKKLLPVYMRPLNYRRIDIMPKTINGKIDKEVIMNLMR
ncbi:AMP-binding protein [Xenorhabdus sp. KJ12.1]|uniref:AMP-binding protein n=1 Tax=Xenorhabdus sp. KJ12.1 TaxID=1851571 RepID=UPI000C05FC8C|nr:AMP-binding protein [Xenorhabdus sp. KJ12.1]PHM72173.1 Amino acid adenylation [Xenorhabdus sp. KJ12.1]